jgi:hypothetical protein
MQGKVDLIASPDEVLEINHDGIDSLRDGERGALADERRRQGRGIFPCLLIL